jgi:hypothetical protein
MKTDTVDTSGFDLIGDIHGHAAPLQTLLKKLGYEIRNGYHCHPSRRVIFVGDLIDRGPAVREVLKIAKGMVDGGAALAIMGNHEYNAICYHTLGTDGEWMRPHSENNQRQHRATLAAFESHRSDWDEYLTWFKELPIYLDLPGLRVVHACWDQKILNQLNNRNRLDDAILHRSTRKGTREHHCLEVLLKGKELRLPDGLVFRDSDGHDRNEIRIKWWTDANAQTYRDLIFPESANAPQISIPNEQLTGLESYPDDAPPVFFGHYWLRSQSPAPLASNVACLDYSVANGGFLAAYRWNGESILDAKKFVISSEA